MREWKRKNKERVNRYNRSWYSKNKEKSREIRRRYRQRHPEKARESTQKWRERNREKARRHYWIQDHKEECPLAKWCELCPSNDRRKATERHHPDYSFPHIYISVCKQCHASADKTTEEW